MAAVLWGALVLAYIWTVRNLWRMSRAPDPASSVEGSDRVHADAEDSAPTWRVEVVPGTRLKRRVL